MCGTAFSQLLQGDNTVNIREFYMGEAFDAYTYFGAHADSEGVVFRTWAPSASKVSVMGEFSGWKPVGMHQINYSDVFECRCSSARAGQMYKFIITGADGKTTERCDPCGFAMELRPAWASIVVDMQGFEFDDGDWMMRRSKCMNEPLNIYEVHLGSWQKRGDGLTDWYNYDELADRLIPYCRENGYTHIEVLPLAEHPHDGSWGYQITGFFSPTARYGTPSQLKSMINKCHKAGIGVIMDFVPVHFAVDGYALRQYDGTALYEYPSSDVGESEWGSCNFMHSRREVCSFLQSCANYWLQEYHFDGLRMDAISRAIYWQHGTTPWVKAAMG